MRIIYLLVCSTFFLAKIGSTQTLYERPPYDHIWLLNASFLDFDSGGELESFSDLNTNYFEGTNASICDDNGELLAYTNGFFIGGRDRDTLENGGGLNPGDYPEWWYNNGLIWPQGAIFLPFTNTTYLIHKSIELLEEPNENGSQSLSLMVLYSSLNNITQRVERKNISIVSDTSTVSYLTATRHSNGQDWWVLSPEYFNNRYSTVLVTADSVQLIGSQAVGEPVKTGLGQAKFSPQGDVYAKLDMHGEGDMQVSIYDFDRCSGQLSNHRHFQIDEFGLTGGLEFSPNGRFLYIPFFAYTFQYDLMAEDIAASRVTVSAPDDGKGYYMAQLGPDDKIYICVQGGWDSLHVIEQPNRKGHACDFRHLGLPLPEISFRTMPNFPYYGLGPLDGSPCDTLNIDNPVPEAAFEYIATDTSTLVEFFDASHFMPAYDERLLDERIGWQWDFGDGSRGDTTRFPVYTFRQRGTYEVCLTVSNVTGVDTYCVPVTVGPNSVGGPDLVDVAVRVWPNPWQEGPLYVQVVGDAALLAYGSAIRFTNAQGQVVYTKELNSIFQQTTVLDLPSLPAGLYFYELVDQRGHVVGSGRISIADR